MTVPSNNEESGGDGPVLTAPASSKPAASAQPTSKGTAAATANVAPVISSIPDGTVNYPSTFTYQVVATGTPAPSFSLSGGPGGLTINRTTGLITFTPSSRQIGAQSVTIKATNSVGSASKSFKLTVTNYVAPVIATPPAQVATAGAAFSYQLAATGTPAPTFALVSGPAGLTVSSSGLVSWTPSAVAAAQSVTVAATNAAGSVSSTFAISVAPDTTPPTTPFVTVGPITTVDSILLSWAPSTDNVGVTGYRIYNYTPAVYRGHSGRGGGITLVSPAKLTLLVDGLVSTSYTFTGLATNSTHQYVVSARDAAGNEAYSAVATGTTLLPPSFDWSYFGATDPAMTVVANHNLTFYFSASGSPYPTLSVVSAPAGVVFTPGQVTNSQLTYVTPNISWTPTPDEVGANSIVMRATNSVGTFTMTIPITVTPDTPQVSVSLNGGITYTAGQFASGQSNYVVTANPGFGNFGYPHPLIPQYALAGAPFNFQVSTASNSGPTTLALVSAPAGMTLDPTTGVGTWTPTKDEAGNTTVLVAATNAAGTSTLHLNFPTFFTGAPGTPAATYVTGTSGVLTNNPVISWPPRPIRSAWPITL